MFAVCPNWPINVRSLSYVGLLLLFVSGCSSATLEPSQPVDESATKPSVSVEVAQAKITTLRPTLDLVGAIVAIPEKTAVISPQVGGWVKQLKVVEGQTVRVGEVLVELDPRSSQVALQRAEAVVAEKKAAVERLKKGYLPEEIAGARQDAANAKATVDGLQNEVTALRDLLDRNEISKVVYETKVKSLESAQAALASAEERAKLFEAGTRPEMIAEAQGLLDAAKADREQARLTLQWCTITSPIEGVLVQLLARQGQFFDRAVPLATVIDLSEVFAQIRIPSSQFTKIQLGTEVLVELSSLPGQSFPGKITRFSGQADPATGNVIVFATINNKDQLLRPGLSCKVQVSLPEISDSLVIPISAVADNSGTPVVTIIRDGKAYETKVELGIETIDLVQILHGLSAGDTVATAGGYGLPVGTSVTIRSPSVESDTKL